MRGRTRVANRFSERFGRTVYTHAVYRTVLGSFCNRRPILGNMATTDSDEEFDVNSIRAALQNVVDKAHGSLPPSNYMLWMKVTGRPRSGPNGPKL